MRFRPFNRLGRNEGAPRPREGTSNTANTPNAANSPNTRRRLMRTAIAMMVAGWVSGLPNPIGSAPLPQTPAGNPPSTPSSPAPSAPSTQTPHFAIPMSLLEEHAELYTKFETARRLPGKTGAAARRVVTLRTPHVQKEQRIAYPLLRLLPMLEKGPVERWMTELLPLADQLRAALPDLKREHVEIVRALDVLHDDAWSEKRPEYAFLAQRMKHHIRMEEDILYPAALVTAEYVRMKKGVARDFDRP